MSRVGVYLMEKHIRSSIQKLNGMIPGMRSRERERREKERKGEREREGGVAAVASISTDDSKYKKFQPSVLQSCTC